MESLECNPSDIKPSPYNPRQITESAKKVLGFSISEFGDISGIVWNKTTGNLITGHQRWGELNEKGEITFKYSHEDRFDIYINNAYSTFDIRIVQWTLEKEKAANISANSHIGAGSFDTEILSTLIAGLKIDMPDVHSALNLNQLSLDLKINFDPIQGKEVSFIAKEKELDENIQTKTECPSCGYKY